MGSNGKVAAGLGSAAGVGTAGTFVGLTSALAAPTANLGGYATAQIVASGLGVGGGPALSAGIAAIGGPVVAGALAATGVGLFVGAGALLVGGLLRRR